MKSRQFLRYILQSSGIFLFHMIFVYTLVQGFDVGSSVAFGFSISLAFLIGFYTLRTFVFNSSSNRIASSFFLMLASSLVFRVGEFYAFKYLDSFNSYNYLLLVAFVLTGSFVLKFLVYRPIFVYRSKLSSSKP